MFLKCRNVLLSVKSVLTTQIIYTANFITSAMLNTEKVPINSHFRIGTSQFRKVSLLALFFV